MTATCPSWHGDPAIVRAMHLFYHQDGRQLTDGDLMALRRARTVLLKHGCYISVLGRFVMGALGEAFSH